MSDEFDLHFENKTIERTGFAQGKATDVCSIHKIWKVLFFLVVASKSADQVCVQGIVNVDYCTGATATTVE